jgi:hypothetical protein
LATLTVDVAEREHLKNRIPQPGCEAIETTISTAAVDKTGDQLRLQN